MSDTPKERAQKIADARLLIDFYEEHPSLPLPYLNIASAWLWSALGDVEIFREYAKIFGDKAELTYDGTSCSKEYAHLKYKVGETGSIHVKIERKLVCAKTTVTKEVTEWAPFSLETEAK